MGAGVDVLRQEDPRVHLPYSVLRLDRHRPMGRFDHLQNEKELRVPTGHEEHVHELWTHFRDSPRCFLVLLSWHGQGLENVPAQVELVASALPLSCMIFIY